jgi:hypothetical protein
MKQLTTNQIMILLYDGNRGIYIPQIAASDLHFTTPLTDEQKEDLSNPDNENYWDTRSMVLNNKTVTDTQTGIVYNLHQDDDLWAIAEGYYLNENGEIVNSETEEIIE